MNLRAILLCGALSAATLPAADTLTGEFQRALFEEEANRNLPAAIAGYEAVIKRLDEQRQLAATAVFRLGESYRKLGKTNEAVAAYERIIKEFADQETLVKLSGQNLSILKPSIAAAPTLDGNNASPSRRWMDSWSPSWQSFLEVVKGFEPMSDGELHTLATAVPEAGIVEAMAKVQKAESAAERFKTHPEDFVIDAKNPNPVEALQLSKDELSNKRASALRTLEALAALERRVAGLGSARSDTGGPEGTATFQQEYLRLKSTLEQLKQSDSRDELKTLVQVLLPDANFAKLDEMEVAARTELAGLKTEFGPDHIEVKKSQSKLDSTTKSIDERIAGAIRAAEIKLAALEQVATGQSDSTSSLDPAARARQRELLAAARARNKELLEQEIVLVEGQVRADDERAKAGSISTVDRIKRQRELLVLRRRLAAMEFTPQSFADQRQLIGEELQLVDQMNEAARLMLEAGRGSRDDLVALERERMHLRRELIDLERASTPTTDTGSAASTMTAEEAEELRRVQALAANSPDLINVVDSSDGQAPLHRAIQKGHQQVVSFLIRNGADLNRPNQSRWLPAHVAARSGQLAALRMLVDAGVDLSARDRSGNTPLHLAIGRAHDSVVSYLLEKGADPEAVDEQGQSSLHLSASGGRTNMMTLLLDGGAGLEIVAPALSQRGIRHGGAEVSLRYNGTPLCFAVANEKTEAVELLLERGANVNPPGVEVQPLAIAVTVGDANMVRRLIKAGAKVDGQPLVERALASMPAEIPFLLEAGANPNLTIQPNSRPVLLRAVETYGTLWAETNRHVPRVDGGVAAGGVVVQGSFGAPPLGLNRNVDWETVMKALVTHGADVNAVHDRRTVLTWLASLPKPTPLEMISWLLEKGADPNLGGGRAASSNVRGRPGRFADGGGFVNSPLNAACQAGNVELVALLIKHGARLEAPEGQDEWSPLHVAVNSRQDDIVQLLLEKGADPNARDSQDKTPLYYLFNRLLPGNSGTLWSNAEDRRPTSALLNLVQTQGLQDELGLARRLLEKGARLDPPLMGNHLPIHFAAAVNDDRFLKLFLEFKTDPNATNAVGVTALHTAAAMNRTESIRLLVQAGADVNRPDQNGDTPLHIAAFLNRVEASEVLLVLGADRERKNRFDRNPVENLVNVKANKLPPFGLPEYLDPIKNVTDVLGR